MNEWLDRGISALAGGFVSLATFVAWIREGFRETFATKDEVAELKQEVARVNTKSSEAHRRVDEHAERITRVEEADRSAERRFRDMVIEPMAKMNQTLERMAENQTRNTTILEMLVDQEKLRRGGQ